MQKKSCFSRKVTESDAFAELSFEAQALYFQLSLAADASGFVSTPKKVQKGMGASSAALEELAGGDYLVFYESGACAITAWEGGCAEEQKAKEDTFRTERVKAQTRERVKRYRARKKEAARKEKEAVCNAPVTAGNAPVTESNAKAPLPLFSPPSSPLSSFPRTPILFSPYDPPQSTPSPPSSSSSKNLFRARAEEMAVRYWDRKLGKYEKDEIYDLAMWLAEEREGRGAALTEEDAELLEIALKAAAEAARPTLTYLRGVYRHWFRKRILTPNTYWDREVDRDVSLGRI